MWSFQPKILKLIRKTTKTSKLMMTTWSKIRAIETMRSKTTITINLYWYSHKSHLVPWDLRLSINSHRYKGFNRWISCMGHHLSWGEIFWSHSLLKPVFWKYLTCKRPKIKGKKTTTHSLDHTSGTS